MMNTKAFDVDVLVAGGGVAGVSAALTAARGGLRTLLLEAGTSLGGLATNDYVSGIAGVVDGNCKEWFDRMAREGYTGPRNTFDPERAKLVMESMLLEAGARILYGVWVIDAVTDNGNIKELVCHSKSGRMAVSAKIYIDATGDADVAAYAGVPYDIGCPEFAGLNMSTTMAFRMANVNMKRYLEARMAYQKTHPNAMNIIADLEEKAVKNGDLPYFIFPTALIYQVPGTQENDADITVMTTHSFHTRNTDVEDLTRQIIEQHQQIQYMEKFLKKYVPGFAKARLTGIANLHGVRDSRRIIGEYILKDEDIVCGRKFEDGIARFNEFLDTHHPTSARLGFMRHIHMTEPKESAVCRPAQCSGDMHPFVRPGGYEARVNPLDYSEIPFRTVIPLKIDNLMVVGRCVSAEFNANAAVRVIAPSMSTGQAAAMAAGLCIKDGAIPRQIDGKLIRKMMIAQGIPLDKPILGKIAGGNTKGEFVVTSGDFIGLKTPDGVKTRI
jgi:hypothetical protein